MKRLIALAALIAAALLALAAPALAWEKMITVDGYAECNPTGAGSVIHWTVTNTSQGNIRLTGSSRPTVVAPDALIGANMGDYFAEDVAAGTSSPQTLTVNWLDADQQTQSASVSVDLPAGCNSPTPTTPPPTSPPPTTTPPPTSTHTVPPPTTFTPPAQLAMTGAPNAGRLLAMVGLLAFAGLVLLAVARYKGREQP